MKQTTTLEPFVSDKAQAQAKTQRTSKYELLRFLAAFFVLAFHCLGSKYTWTWSILNIFLVVPVPLFIFLSGFFLANSKKAKILKYLWMLLIFYLINILISYLFFSNNLIHENIRYRVSFEWILKFGWGPWWYFWTIPILYLIAPFLNFGLKSLNKWYSLSFIIVFYFIWFFTMNISYFPQRLVDGGQILFLFIIYMLGAWWKLYGSEVKIQNVALKVAIAFLVILEVINLILFATLKITIFTMGKDWIIGGYDSVEQKPAVFAGKDTVQPFAILSAMAIFIIFQNLKWKYNPIFNFLGKLSIPLFLYHFAFMNLVNDTIAPKILTNITNPDLHGIVSTLLVTSLSLVFSIIIIMPVEYLVNKGMLLSYYVTNKTKNLIHKNPIALATKTNN